MAHFIRILMLMAIMLLYFSIGCEEDGTSDFASYNSSLNNFCDNMRPGVVITGGPAKNSVIETDSVTFEWGGTDSDGIVEGYYYSMDHNPPNIFTTETSFIFHNLANGKHIFRVKAIDNEGMLSHKAFRMFRVNASVNQPPAVVITSGPTGDTTETQPTFTFAGLDADGTVKGYYADIDNPEPGIWTTAGSWTPLTPLPPGPHVFYVLAEDDGGMVSALAELSFNVVEAGGEAIIANEDFSDGSLDSVWELLNCGNCNWSIGQGLLTMALGTSLYDAGLCNIVPGVDVSKDLNLKVRFRSRNVHYALTPISIGQVSGDSNIINGYCGLINMHHWDNGKFHITCVSSNGGKIWDYASGSWIPYTIMATSYQGELDKFYTFEIKSTAENWTLSLYDENENLILQTSPILWAEMKDFGQPHKIFMGDFDKSNTYGDMDFDYIDISFTPE